MISKEAQETVEQALLAHFSKQGHPDTHLMLPDLFDDTVPDELDDGFSFASKAIGEAYPEEFGGMTRVASDGITVQMSAFDEDEDSSLVGPAVSSALLADDLMAEENASLSAEDNQSFDSSGDSDYGSVDFGSSDFGSVDTGSSDFGSGFDSGSFDGGSFDGGGGSF